MAEICSAAKHTLTGRRLLACGAVAGLIRIDHGADPHVCKIVAPQSERAQNVR